MECLFEETDFVHYLHSSPFQTDKNRRDFLCKTFVRATEMEKRILAECEELRPHLLDMMLTIAKAVTGHEKLLNGFRGSFTGFIKIFKEKVAENISHENFDKFLKVIAAIPSEIYVEQSFVVNKLIVEMLKMKETGEEKEEVIRNIEQFPESSGKTHLLEQIRVQE